MTVVDAAASRAGLYAFGIGFGSTDERKHECGESSTVPPSTTQVAGPAFLGGDGAAEVTAVDRGQEARDARERVT